MTFRAHEFAARPAVIRQAVERYGPWIEAQLGVPMSDTIIVDGLPNLSQVGIQKFLGIFDRRRAANREASRLRSLVAHAKVPPDDPPILAIADDVRVNLSLEALLEDRAAAWTGFEWRDGPLALRLHVYDCTIVILNVAYVSGPDSPETAARLLVARRDSVQTLLRLFDDLYRRDRVPHLNMVGGKSRRVLRTDWSELVIDANVSRLLKDDFDTFWQRETWFRERNLPFRRGYLLHGPPGNGKTSAIRAMMSSRALNAYTLRFFDLATDDGYLDSLFERAHRNRPAMVLLEDIDRAFPKAGEPRSKVSLQHLLNCLDGVATGEGLVIVATANDPALLDPAILRRPGRFDRVVHFPNPDENLRLEYFRKMNVGLHDSQLQRPVQDSEGFSFAQLKEAYISAGNLAFERGGDVTEQDLLAAIQSLLTGFVSASRRSTSAGFHKYGKEH